MKRSGKFKIRNGRELSGELTIAGLETGLYVYDSEEFDAHVGSEDYVRGILHDLKHVSLHDCIAQNLGGSNGPNGRYHYANIFPHFVLEGEQHLGPMEDVVTEIEFVLDDGQAAFYDFDAFAHVIDAEPFIEKLAKSNLERIDPTGERSRKIEFGPSPLISYFTGKDEIIAVETVLGTFKAAHRPKWNLGGPGGVWIKNTIVTSISFKTPCLFEEAVERFFVFLRFLELLIGRPQNLEKVSVWVRGTDKKERRLQVHWSHAPTRDRTNQAERGPHPSEVLLDAVRRADEFRKVLSHWVDRHATWSDARAQFSRCFNKQLRFDIDRIVAAANMFDILPASAVPQMINLPQDLLKAKEDTRIIFKALPNTPESNSILSALGRLGAPVLKHKIRHRAAILEHAAGSKFSELALVTDEAVQCRNHYVHGSDASFDYNANFHAVVFMTTTLEFVFAASDLLEAGWDIKIWMGHGTIYAHPFGQYAANYRETLPKFKSLLSKENGTQ